MFEFYHDMAGSNVGIGSMAFISKHQRHVDQNKGWLEENWMAQIIPIYPDS